MATFFITGITGHTTAAGLQQVIIHPHFFAAAGFLIHSHNSLMMAVFIKDKITYLNVALLPAEHL
ncbi:MAG: hypothetical protein WD139_06920 [Balneolaceae bacterium]